MKNITLLILLIFLLCTPAYNQDATPFSVEQILSAPFPTSLTAAPSGDRLAWVYNKEGVRNIWVAEGPEFRGQAITKYEMDDGQGIGNLVFSPDGKQLVYVRGGGPNRRGEIPNPTNHPDAAKREIFVTSFAGNAPQLISEGSSPSFSPDGQWLVFLKKGQVWIVENKEEAEAKQLFKIRGSAGSLRWSPDSKNHKLAFTSSRGDHSFVGIYDFNEHKIQYLAPSVDRDNSPVWSPDGNQLAFLRIRNEKQILPFSARRSGLGWSIHVANVATGETQLIWQSPEGSGSVFRNISAVNQIFWMADDHIVFPWEGNGWTQLYRVSSTGGKEKRITSGKFEVQYVYIASNRQTLLFSSNQDDINRQHLWSYQAGAGDIQSITKGKGVEWAPVATAGSGHIACLASTGTYPAYAARIDKGSLLALAPKALPADYPLKALVEPEAVVFPASDGMQIHGQLFKPPNLKEGEKRPAVLFFHGGSRRQMLMGFHHRGYYHNAYSLHQYMANQGYIVLSVNYRSGIGYGMKFREALNYGAQGASEFNDVLGAGLYMRNRADVDPTRIGLWGGSYGGFLTAMGLAKASDLFAAGVDIHGVHDWNVVIKNFVPNYNSEARQEFAKLAYDSSPMAYVKDWKSPVLLIHGDDDRNVPFSESVDLAESLRRQGVYFEQLIFPDEVHGFLLHDNWKKALEATATFLDRKLKP